MTRVPGRVWISRLAGATVDGKSLGSLDAEAALFLRVGVG